MHHEIIAKNEYNPQIQQTSLAELHRLNITLSNYFEVAPTVINGITLPTAPKQTSDQKIQNQSQSSLNLIFVLIS